MVTETQVQDTVQLDATRVGPLTYFKTRDGQFVRAEVLLPGHAAWPRLAHIDADGYVEACDGGLLSLETEEGERAIDWAKRYLADCGFIAVNKPFASQQQSTCNGMAWY